MLAPFFIGGARGKTFTKEFMAQFEDEHRKFFNTPVPPAGLPDVGSGRFAAKLDYKSWMEFSKRQYLYMNLIEELPLVLTLIFITGLGSSISALIIGGFYFIARIIMIISWMHVNNLVARVLLDRPIVWSKWALFALSLYSAAKYLKIYNDYTQAYNEQSFFN